MHSEHRRHGCCEEHAGQSRGPEIFYGYCHETGRMRMMNYPDYAQNLQTGLSNMMQGTGMQPMMQAMMNAMTGMAAPAASPMPGGAFGYGSRREHDSGYHDHWHHRHEDCRCHEHHHDCGCQCCIRCADVVEYARCGEIRRIPITFDNDTRRERNVKLTLGAFATASGQEAGWETQVSDPEFKLGPCGEKTVVVSVRVDCSKIGTTQPGSNNERQPNATVDSCKVAYASLTAEGCTIRPTIIAVAVLPEHCEAHHASCGCGCCG